MKGNSIGNTTVQRVKFERNRNTTSEEWNLKSKFQYLRGWVQISRVVGGISYKHHDPLFWFFYCKKGCYLEI